MLLSLVCELQSAAAVINHVSNMCNQQLCKLNDTTID